MKTAIYVEDGVVQLVCTPESEFEKNCLSAFEGRDMDVRVFSGAFYDCRGGWVRQTAYRPPDPLFHGQPSDDRSIIIRVFEMDGPHDPQRKRAETAITETH